MKKLKLFFACLLMAVLSIGQVWGAPTEESVTLSSGTFSTDHITWSAASGKITISQLKGSSSAAVNSSYVSAPRVYKGHVLSFVAADGYKINSIEITCATTYYGNSMTAGTVYSSNTVTDNTTDVSRTWTSTSGGKHVVSAVDEGGLSAIYIQNVASSTNTQLRFTALKISYTTSGSGSGKENLTDEQLSWSATSANITFGDEPYSLPSLTNSIPVSVTYESTAEAVATISNVGVVSVLKAGSTTIKAVFAGNDDYNAKTVSYTLTVAPAPLTPIAGGIVDEIKISDLLTSGSGYQPFSDKQASNEGHSDAVYAGKVCISSTNIQMNTIGTNTSAGRSIVTTTSGGNAKRVQAFWGGTNTADRKLTVYGSNTAYAGTETAASGTKLGDLTYASGDSYAYIDITGDYAYLQIVASGAIYMSQINITWVAPDVSKVATPEISGTANFYPSTSVSISCSTDDATIYYTTDGTAPTSASTLYEGAFTVNTDGTTTVKAIAVKDGMTDSDVAERTFTKATVLTVAEAIALIPNKDDVVNDQYVAGIVCTAAPSLLSGGKLTYYISADGSETNRLQIYKGKNLNNTEFTAVSDLAIGDRVTVFGQLKNYNGTPEMNDGNYLVSKAAPAVAAPTFSPDGGGFTGETDVTISCATASSAIYYTLDGSAPSKLSTLYESAIHLNATTTINAIAFVGDDASLVISRTFTLSEPMTVAEALTALDSENPINNVAVAGIISTAPTSNPSNGKLIYFISDDGSASNELEVYKGFGIGGASFSDKTDLQVGDEVTVFGNLTIYNTTKEFAEGNRLLAFNRPEVAVTGIDLTESTAEVEIGKTVTLHASVVPANATNKTIVWSVQSGSDYASVENGVVTGIAVGEAVIRAASVADGTKYAECTVTVVAADPTKHKVTFDATVDMGESPLSKSNISMACTSGVLDNGSEYRLYKSSTTTFECSVGNIIKIEFTGVSGNPVSGFGDPEVGTLVTEGNNGVWTGNAESVSFVASGAQVRATEIVVTYKEDNRAAAGLTWSTDAVELTVGDEFTAPTLNNPNSIAASAITIASDNTELATVSEGVVSLVADATGTATITATFEGNEDYKPAVVSYTITVNEAGLDNVTFDATQDIAGTNELSISKSGFTLEFTDGALGNGSEYRLYKSQTMTLSSTDYLIKKIEFTCTSGNPISGFADAEGLDKANNQWTGEANSIELTASNAQVRIEKLKVYYIEDTRAASGLAWSTDEVEITLGDDFTAASLVNPNSIDAAEILIESSNTDLAVINNGAVELVADATGTATITATFAGNATYKPAEFSYTIKVNDPTPQIYVNKLNVNFGTVATNAGVDDQTITVTLTNVASVTASLGGTNPEAFNISPASLTESGDITISFIGSTATAASYAATVTISDGAEGAEDKTVNLSLKVENVESAVSTESKWIAATDADLVDGAEVLIVGVHPTTSTVYAAGEQGGNNRAAVAASVDGEGVLTPGANTMSFILEAQEGGKFALRTSNGKYLCAASSGSNYLRTQDVLDDNGKWTLTTTSAVANGSYTRNTMFFNSSSSLFACYASSTTTQQPIAFYVPKPVTPPTPVYETVRSGLEINRYYTVCLPKQVTAIKGATFWKLEKKSEDGSQAYLEEETNNLPFAAGKPFIIQATTDKLEVVYEGEPTETAGVNGAIHGTLTYMDADALAAAGSNVYMLYNNELRPVGENNHLDANRAYVKVDELDPVSSVPQGAPGKRVVAMPMQKDQAQGFENLDASEKPMKVMIEGTLYILRGEKVYDATGRLVK